MSATLLFENRAPNGYPVLEYRLTWWNNVKTETLPLLPQIDVNPYRKFGDMDDLHTWPFAYMYLEYDYNGVHLQREAVNCIMGMVFYGEDYQAHHNKWTKLDNIEDELVTKVRELAAPFRAEWKPCIDGWYQEAYNRYPSFKARHDYLPGLVGKLPRVALEKKCLVGGAVREIWEICIAYIIVNFCRTHEGEVFSKDEHKDIISHWWKAKPEKASPIITRLANPDEKDTKKIKSIVSNYTTVLMTGANMVVKKYEVEVLGMAPRTGDALLATTESLAGLSLAATASGPSRSVAPATSQATGPSASQLTVPATGTPSAGESGGADPRDKGKGRARESTSDSSGGDKSGKGKGKGKKPRREK